jgi:hemerythrin superfamily protein
MPNGIDLLVAEHEAVNELFGEIDATGGGPAVGRIVDALTAHDEAEHTALYPMCAELLGDDELVGRCKQAHSEVKRQIDLVNGLEGAPLVEAVTALQELVAAHVQDEETELFPRLADIASAAQLEALGARLLQAKQRVG